MRHLNGSLFAVLAVATVTGCVQPKGAPARAPLPAGEVNVDWRNLSALSKDRTPELEAALTDLSFLVRQVNGRDYVYFGPGGRAWFWNNRTRLHETGWWTVVAARFGDDAICWGRGVQPEIAGGVAVERCRGIGSFVGVADTLARGDVYGISAGRSPE